MRAATESQLVTACLRLLAARKVFAWRSNAAAVPLAGGGYRRFRGLRGVSDILGVLDDGRILAVEVKTATGRLSPHQRTFLDEVCWRGGLALVVRDVKELDAALAAELEA